MTPAETVRLLFVCVENACRSQMAEGFARARAADGVAVWSAGSRPAQRVHPKAVRLMAEVGIDLTPHSPTGLDDLPQGEAWDLLVTLGCDDACPHLPARRRVDWDLPDPKEMDDPDFRRVRDEIADRVARLMARVAAAE